MARVQRLVGGNVRSRRLCFLGVGGIGLHEYTEGVLILSNVFSEMASPPDCPAGRPAL